MFKRRREQRTDYKQRLALLRSGKPRFAVRKSHNGFRVQIIVFDEKGDKTLVEDSSKTLRKYGWMGHGGSTPSAYLTGLLVGIKARKSNIPEAITDIGLQMSVKGAALYAVVAGARDAGLKVPMGDIAPDPKRISGKHIADYALMLKKNDMNAYKKNFSSYLKNNLPPENLPQHFEEIKKKILAADSKKEYKNDA